MSRTGQRGFTLLELLIVVTIVALASAVVTMALPDPASTRLEREASRLAAILEAARVQARAGGLLAGWAPGPARRDGAADADFHVEGLGPDNGLPEHWAERELSGQIQIQLPPGQRLLVLGPEPVIPAQRLVLRLDDRSVVLGTDGLAPFAVVPESADAQR
ncbi:MAG: type secretion system protein GspH [Pseudomonadota bacterium]